MIETIRFSPSESVQWPRLRQMDKDLKKTIKDLGFLSSVGMAMAISIALGALIGFYLDKWLDTKPWLFIIFLCFGIAAAFSNLYKLYKKADRF